MRKHVLILVCFLWVLSGSCVMAESRIANLLTFYYPPFMNGDRSGLGEKLHIAAFQERGYEVIFQYYPHKRARKIFSTEDHYLYAGTNEFVMFDIASDIEFFNVIYIQIVLVCMKDRFPHLNKIDSLEALKNKTVGCQRGAHMIPIYKEAGIEIDIADNFESNIRKLERKRIDFLSTVDLTAKKMIDNIFEDRKSEFAILKFKKIMGGLTVKKGSLAEEAFQECKEGFKAIKENGIYLKILEEFYGKEQVPDSAIVK